jgi:anti-sigma factor ChrR (cupin superfamily)
MIADEVNRLLATGAKESEVPTGGVQMERMDKIPQPLGDVRLNQALWYLSHGRNASQLTDYNSGAHELATHDLLARAWATA